MAEELRELKDEMAKTFEAFKVANDAKIAEIEKRGAPTAETDKKVETMNAEITELRTQIKDLEKDIELRKQRPAKQDKDGKEVDPDIELRSAAYEKYIRYGVGETGSGNFTPDEMRALAGTSDDDGQFLVPDDFETSIIMNAFDMAEVRPLCDVGTTSRDTVKLGALSKPTVAWGTRGLAVSQTTLNTGGITIPIKNVRALTLISNDILDDSAANVMGELEMGFQKAVAEAEDDAFMVGVATNSPKGILSSSAVQALYTATGISDAVYSAAINGIDALKTMFFSLKKTYRRNATWAMNSTTEGVFRSLKDGEGRYLWDTGVIAGTAPTLMGRPMVNPEGMADIAAGAFPVLFGDFRSGYKIRDRSGLVIKRLVERYAEYDQTAFLLKKRVGGGVALAEAFVCLKVSAS